MTIIVVVAVAAAAAAAAAVASLVAAVSLLVEKSLMYSCLVCCDLSSFRGRWVVCGDVVQHWRGPGGHPDQKPGEVRRFDERC